MRVRLRCRLDSIGLSRFRFTAVFVCAFQSEKTVDARLNVMTSTHQNFTSGFFPTRPTQHLFPQLNLIDCVPMLKVFHLLFFLFPFLLLSNALRIIEMLPSQQSIDRN